MKDQVANGVSKSNHAKQRPMSVEARYVAAPDADSRLSRAIDLLLKIAATNSSNAPGDGSETQE